MNRLKGVGRGVQELYQARLPWLFVALIVAIHLPLALAGGYEKARWWFEMFGLSREGLGGFHFWQIGSYALLHGNWLHLLTNAGCLLMLGARIERVLGRAILLRTTGLCVLGGAAGYLALVPGGILVGSSPIAFGFLVLMTTVSPESRMWPLMVSGRVLGVLLLAGSGLLALMDPAVRLPGFAEAGRFLTRQGLGSWWQVSHACHFGGGLAGWLYGRWMLRPRVTLEKLRRERLKRESGR